MTSPPKIKDIFILCFGRATPTAPRQVPRYSIGSSLFWLLRGFFIISCLFFFSPFYYDFTVVPHQYWGGGAGTALTSGAEIKEKLPLCSIDSLLNLPICRSGLPVSLLMMRSEDAIAVLTPASNSYTLSRTWFSWIFLKDQTVSTTAKCQYQRRLLKNCRVHSSPPP